MEKAEMLKKDFVFAVETRIKEAGGQTKLAEMCGLRQATISDYSLGKTEIESLSVGTLLKLFPNFEMSFLGMSSKPTSISESQSMEEELLKLFRGLTPPEKARCLLVIGAHFRDSIVK